MSDGKQPTTLQVHEVSHPEPSQNPITNTESPEPNRGTTVNTETTELLNVLNVEVPAQEHSLEPGVLPPKTESYDQFPELDPQKHTAAISSVSGIPASPEIQVEYEVDPASLPPPVAESSSQAVQKEVLDSSIKEEEEEELITKTVVAPKPNMVLVDVTPSDGVHALPYKEDGDDLLDGQISSNSDVAPAMPHNADSVADELCDGVFEEWNQADTVNHQISFDVHEFHGRTDSVCNEVSDTVHEVPCKADSVSDGFHQDGVPGNDDSVADQISDGVDEGRLPGNDDSVADLVSDDVHALPGKGDSATSDAVYRTVKDPAELSAEIHHTELDPVSDTTQAENSEKSEQTENKNTIKDGGDVKVLSEEETATPLTRKDSNPSETTETMEVESNRYLPGIETNGEVSSVETLENGNNSDVAPQQTNDVEFPEMQAFDNEKPSVVIPVQNKEADFSETLETQKSEVVATETNGEVLAVVGFDYQERSYKEVLVPVQSKDVNATEAQNTNNEVIDTVDCKTVIANSIYEVSSVEAPDEQEVLVIPALTKQTSASGTIETQESDIDVPAPNSQDNGAVKIQEEETDLPESQEIQFDEVPATEIQCEVPADVQEIFVTAVHNEENMELQEAKCDVLEAGSDGEVLVVEAFDDQHTSVVPVQSKVANATEPPKTNTDVVDAEVSGVEAVVEQHAFVIPALTKETNASETTKTKETNNDDPQETDVPEAQEIQYNVPAIEANGEAPAKESFDLQEILKAAVQNKEISVSETIESQEPKYDVQDTETDVTILKEPNGNTDKKGTMTTTEINKSHDNETTQNSEVHVSETIENTEALRTRNCNMSEENHDSERTDSDLSQYPDANQDDLTVLAQEAISVSDGIGLPEELVVMDASMEGISSQKTEEVSSNDTVPTQEDIQKAQIEVSKDERQIQAIPLQVQKHENQIEACTGLDTRDEPLSSNAEVQQELESIEEKLVQSISKTENYKEHIEVLHSALRQDTDYVKTERVVEELSKEGCDTIAIPREVPPVEESARQEPSENGKAVHEVIKDAIVSLENNNSSVQQANPVDDSVSLKSEITNETLLIPSSGINVPVVPANDTNVIHAVSANEASEASERDGGDFGDIMTPVPKEYNPEPSRESVNAHNHVQCVTPLNHVKGREELPEDENDTSLKEKSSTGMKIPLIVAGLAIATVGVAVASISRSR